MPKKEEVPHFFINYRTADDRFGVALLDRALSERFGSSAVFLAAKSIPPGACWEKRMFEAVGESSALLVVMGKKWLGKHEEGALARLDDEDDFVRREILLAKELDKQVVPVRLDVPRIPRRHFPEDLRFLADLQDVEIRFRHSRLDIDDLANRLSADYPELTRADSPKADRARFTASGKHNTITQADVMHISGNFVAGATKNFYDKRAGR
ncbi:toll/interleukin-1 receptor domain-containing protein [Actinosynnema pretiosum subsp. pretiosum]|uniref:Toll/interleukin-1 receptor domain-containing protein n=1 Tax=Actinosynnema pretiosum subsp. pretiosum TaxID=103721 RepID=A0AA45R539_9PSEU|nr:hypothetical protein APASM_3053 [Actinosynnema pretiosum subsp. pretiosum]QUF05434.1 toll/interleukin-1 receptor domain-containing protein [Actinosynnema pretiosum subsp. pretiosum]